MRKSIGVILPVIIFFNFGTVCGQILKRALFEPGKISTPAVEFAPTFSTGGDEIYFARSKDEWGAADMKSAIYHSVKRDGEWSVPEIAIFSGTYDDGDPHLAQDGRTLYFVSKRPSQKGKNSADIWMVRKGKTGKWGEPVRLDEPVNSNYTEYSPCTDAHGNLYFASDRQEGYGQGDLYKALWKGGAFLPPVNMGKTINSNTGEWNLEVGQGGDLIIFEASQRRDNISSYGDLYISFRKGDTWTEPANLTEINTSGSDLYPFLTDNEETLFFVSSDSLKGKRTHIYSIPFLPILQKYQH